MELSTSVEGHMTWESRHDGLLATYGGPKISLTALTGIKIIEKLS